MTFRSKIKSRIKETAKGSTLIHWDILNNDIGWFCNSPVAFLRSAVHYTRFSLHSGVGFLEQLRKLNNCLAKFLWLTMLPVGLLTFLKDGK
jgi:hypothetical protein